MKKNPSTQQQNLLEAVVDPPRIVAVGGLAYTKTPDLLQVAQTTRARIVISGHPNTQLQHAHARNKLNKMAMVPKIMTERQDNGEAKKRHPETGC